MFWLNDATLNNCQTNCSSVHFVSDFKSKTGSTCTTPNNSHPFILLLFGMNSFWNDFYEVVLTDVVTSQQFQGITFLVTVVNFSLQYEIV